MATRNTLVDLDALFDTRLSLLYSLDTVTVSKLIENGQYLSRVKDNFDAISYDIFHTLYRQRNKLLLSHSLPTHIVQMVREHYGEMLTEAKKTGSDDKPIIYVNIHPYALTLEEQTLLTHGIVEVIPDAVIKIVSMDNDTLTPEWIYDNVDVVIKYDALEWLEYNTGTLKLINFPLVNTVIISPALVEGHVSTSKINKDLFNGMINAASLVINLTLVDAKYFSAVI